MSESYIGAHRRRYVKRGAAPCRRRPSSYGPVSGPVCLHQGMLAYPQEADQFFVIV